MAHSYASQYPANTKVDAGIKGFFEKFYSISDTPSAHSEYVNSFTDTAIFILASKKAVGHEQILEIRKGMWEKVAERLHTPRKIFPFGDGSQEVMIYGTVEYVLKNERRASVEWAARAEMVRIEENGEWKMRFYQVYLDTAAMQNAK